jgi:hypothetical protein
MILRNSYCNLTSHFGVIAHIRLVISLSRHKWYQSNLVTSCGAKALHNDDLDEKVKDLSEVNCDTQVSPTLGR